jgi:hypothetical protein
MFGQVDRILSRAYGMSEACVLWVNVVLALFVTLAHGGALIAAESRSSPELGDIRAVAMFSLPLCAVILISALAVLAYKPWARQVLALHAVIASLSAAGFFLWAITLLLRGFPEGNFVWTVGILSAWVGYATVLALRFLLARTSSALSAVYYVPALAFLVALAVDIGVLLRALSTNTAI